MGYLHIENLYKDISILQFRNCVAMEKVHGTSAHLEWNGKTINYSPGGCHIDLFKSCFNHVDLINNFDSLGMDKVVVYGEAYGGKQQGMSDVYGDKLRFIAFDVKVHGEFQAVSRAEYLCQLLDLEFVPYEIGPAVLEWINQQRDAESVVAIRRGMGKGKEREGVVLRPVMEMNFPNGARVIAKHKRDKFRETTTIREIDFNSLKVLEDANLIAEEWVTDMRLTHVLDKLPKPYDISLTSTVIKSMLEDVLREAKGEIVDSKEARKAIGSRTTLLYKKFLSRQNLMEFS